MRSRAEPMVAAENFSEVKGETSCRSRFHCAFLTRKIR